MRGDRPILRLSKDSRDYVMSVVTPYLDDGGVSWTHGILATAGNFGKKEFSLNYARKQEIVDKVKTVLRATFPEMEIRDARGLRIFRKEDQETIRAWISIPSRQISRFQAHGKLNVFRHACGKQQMMPRLTQKQKDSIHTYLESTVQDPYKKIALNEWCSPNQVQYQANKIGLTRRTLLTPEIKRFIEDRALTGFTPEETWY